MDVTVRIPTMVTTVSYVAAKLIVQEVLLFVFNAITCRFIAQKLLQRITHT